MSYLNYSIYHDVGFSSREISSLLRFLEERPSIHWIKLNEETGIFELVVDNSILSSFRTCQSLFFNIWTEGYSGLGGRSWILDFGTLFHKMMEIYYQEFRKSSFKLTEWAIQRAKEEWFEARMDFHSGHKEFITMNGLIGFCALLGAYAARFNAENEHLRVIGTEIAFGRNREVSLGSLNLPDTPWLQVYLAGRIDILIDDRTSICPLDHKTKGTLRNDPNKSYELDEGPTGYIFAINQILPKLAESLGDDTMLQRSCNKILMNYISKTPTPDPNDRFQRKVIMKTREQLESYRLRMLDTSNDLFHALVRYASTGRATRSTDRCTGLYGSDCQFINVHRQNSKENEETMLKQFFVKRSIWNTENVEKASKEGKEKGIDE